MDRKKMNRFIEPLNMDGLSGRMLKMPAPKNKNTEILLLYGHHSSLERMFGFAELLNRYGAVTMPDLPGFGGMDPFYKKNIEPNFEAYADYLAAFFKLKYKRKKVIVVGFSYSVPVIIRMLQKYPELQKRVHYVVSIVGFVHKEDFHIPKKYIRLLQTLTYLGSKRTLSFVMKTFFFREPFIRLGYMMMGERHQKMRGASKEEKKARIDFEVELWRINDLRTWMYTLNEMFRIDMLDGKIHVPMHHATTADDAYLNRHVVDQHMQIIFDKYKSYDSSLPNHAPSIIATAEEVEPYIPSPLQKVLLNS